MSRIMDAALDPSCLLCLTPQGWWSPIRQGVVWPGSSRNFASEPVMWWDFYVLCNGFAGDYDVLFDFFAGSDVTSAAFWHMSSYQNTINIYAVNATTYVVRMSPDGTTSNLKEYIINITTFGGFGHHILRAKKRGTTLTLLIDGVSVFTATGFGSYYMSSAPQTSWNGTFRSISFVDASANKAIWFYPSDAERMRLVTYVNVRTDRGRFEAANTSLGWSIKTALPAGLTGTVLAKINGVVVTNPTKWNRTTATFTGLAADTLDWLMVRNTTLSASQIAYLSN